MQSRIENEKKNEIKPVAAKNKNQLHGFFAKGGRLGSPSPKHSEKSTIEQFHEAMNKIKHETQSDGNVVPKIESEEDIQNLHKTRELFLKVLAEEQAKIQAADVPQIKRQASWASNGIFFGASGGYLTGQGTILGGLWGMAMGAVLDRLGSWGKTGLALGVLGGVVAGGVTLPAVALGALCGATAGSIVERRETWTGTGLALGALGGVMTGGAALPAIAAGALYGVTAGSTVETVELLADRCRAAR